MVTRSLVFALCIAAAAGVNVRHLRQRTNAKMTHETVTIHDLPPTFVEAGFEDEDFAHFTKKQTEAFNNMLPGRKPTQDKISQRWLMRFMDSLEDWPEAKYAAEDAPRFAEVETKMTHETVTIHDLPPTFVEAGFEDEDFEHFTKKQTEAFNNMLPGRKPTQDRISQRWLMRFMDSLEDWPEAKYAAEADTPRFAEVETKMTHETVTIHDLPPTFVEAGFEDEDFEHFTKKQTAAFNNMLPGPKPVQDKISQRWLMRFMDSLEDYPEAQYEEQYARFAEVRSGLKAAKDIHDIPVTYQEAGFTDEHFSEYDWDVKQHQGFNKLLSAERHAAPNKISQRWLMRFMDSLEDWPEARYAAENRFAEKAQAETETKLTWPSVTIHDLPANFQEAGFVDEEFSSWGDADKQAAAFSAMLPGAPTPQMGIESFATLHFPERPNWHEAAYEGASSFIEQKAQTQVASDNPREWPEASYH